MKVNTNCLCRRVVNDGDAHSVAHVSPHVWTWIHLVNEQHIAIRETIRAVGSTRSMRTHIPSVLNNSRIGDSSEEGSSCREQQHYLHGTCTCMCSLGSLYGYRNGLDIVLPVWKWIG